MGAIAGEYDDKKQAVAICHAKWRDMHGGKKPQKAGRDWHKLNYIVPITEAIGKPDSFIIRGVAINETTTRNNHVFLAEELEKSAESLRDKPILKDHLNSVDAIVGRTTQNVSYDRINKNIPFEGRIVDRDIQQKIKDGLVKSVSVGAMVKDLERGEEDRFIARGIEFVELSLVAVPADPEAGFAKAMRESFELKEKDGDEDEDKDDDLYEEEKMGETKEVDKMESDVEILKKEIAEMKAKKAEEESKKQLSEAVAKAVAEKEVELTKKFEELSKKNETKGVVSEAPKQNTELDGIAVERSDLGKGVAIFRESYDATKFKRLGR